MKRVLISMFIFSFSFISFSQEVMPDNEIYVNPETLPKEVRLKIDCFVGLNIKISYNEIDGSHVCNAAEFFLFANEVKLMNINEGFTANLNNGNSDETLLNGEKGTVKELLNIEYPNVGGSRGEVFIVSQINAINIFKNNEDVVTLFLECSTPINSDRGHGFGKCHSSVPEVEISKLEFGKGEVILYHEKPNVVGVTSEDGKDRVALITISSCGILINEGI